ncbi:hypothetical protein [Microbacterium thalli]|uniref:hypothetical protein n=1 Tax=Microbacterium thalli TaxID=3027921 RepID=UPI00265AF9C6|nr:hypothetical protein [Microbacterium thalli]
MTLSDGEWAQRADTWGVVVVSVIVAVLLPIVTWRKMAEELLRDKVLLSPRGGVLTGVSVLSAVLIVAGAPFVFLATRYAFV